MRRTLRFRLTVSVVAALAIVFAGFSALVYTGFARALWRAFDERLASESAALAKMVDEHSDFTFYFEYTGFADFEDARRPAYFQIWRPPKDKVLARSPLLGQGDLPRRPAPTVFHDRLPDGRPGRYYQAALVGRWHSKSRPIPPALRSPLIIVVARATDEVDARLVRMRVLLGSFGMVALLGSAAVVAFVVSRGLRPAAALGEAISRIDGTRLGERITVADLPRELEPPVAKLNETLARLDEFFARERRFTADVSHELRTPLAGLRAILEVGASRERTAEESRAILEDAMAVVRQMHGLVENLLMLARVDAREMEVAQEPVALWALVEDCWRPLGPQARARRLTFTNRLSPDDTVTTDPDKLRIVVANLLSNAVQYTEEGGRIEVQRSDETWLDVYDSGPPIPAEALPRLFERFYRGDAARSSAGVHCGIGLALVDALCPLLGLRPLASNLPDGGVRFRLFSSGSHADG